jgi:FAD/FMN-containing dehydrogenase
MNPSAPTNAHNAASEAEALRERMLGEVITPTSDGYDEARVIFNAMIDRRPALIAKVAHRRDVAEALAFARERALPVSVRNGGHSVAGAGLVEDGVVIDMRRMNSLVVDPVSRIATVAGGATWGDFDAATQPHSLAATGGRVSTTGVAGLTLGGGSGWLERKLGLACDALEQVTLVTAEGETVVASESQNEELFWALHGGGGNFGVVVEMRFRLQPLAATTLGFLTWSPEQLPELARRYRDMIEADAPEELGGGLLCVTGPDEEFIPEHLRGKLTAAVVAVYAGTEDEAREALTPVLELAPEGTLLTEMPYAAIQSALDDPPGFRNYWSAEHLSELPDAALDSYCERAHEMPMPSASQHILFPGGGAAARGSGDWPLPWRTAPWTVHPLGLWEDPADDERGIAWARSLCEDMRPYATGDVYLNFVGDEGDERVQAGYGGSNLERMTAVKTQFDPDNVFNLHHNIKPAG